MLRIGDKIRTLRKAQDVTQEKLAAYLNISYQAISKWENGNALPDITLIPRIANFFGVSADELLCMKETEETEELREYAKLYHENNHLGKVLDNIALSREVLTRYPRNYQWMLNLAYPLIQYNDTPAHSKYSSEHGFIEEAIRICERILEDCTVDPIRHSAIQILCYSYGHVDKEDLALKLANEMPDMCLCREHLLTHIYRGEKQIEACQQTLLSMIDSSSGIIGMLASDEMLGRELTARQKAELIETANALYKLILNRDEDRLFYECRLCRNYSLLAELRCAGGEAEKAMESLLLAEKSAARYDACAALPEQKYRSVLANRCTFDPNTVGRNWRGTETGTLLASLQRKSFDCIRENDDFKQLLVRLKSIS